MVAVNPCPTEHLVCPRDKTSLRFTTNKLTCLNDHEYRIVDGIPIMLLQEVQQTHRAALASLQMSDCSSPLKTEEPRSASAVDPYVQQAVAGTNGMLYKPLLGGLSEYPIPDLRLPRSDGAYFLDLGCNWGRWCVAAARLGYYPIGVDPSLEAILAAKRVAQQLGVQTRYVVADARYLPFAEQTFDVVFSYSVLQHFAKENVKITLGEIHRVLKPGGNSLVQMANMYGVRSLYHQIRRGFREAKDFEVRYWTLAQLKSTFSGFIGPADISVDGYFSLNPQMAEAHLLPWKYQLVVRASELLRHLSASIPPMAYFADSLYVHTQRGA